MNPLLIRIGLKGIWMLIRRRREKKQRKKMEEMTMSLSTLFDSTKNKGMSKKIVVLFVTGTLLPLLSSLGVPENILTILGQIAAIYLGGQSIADAAHNFNGAKKEN